MTNQFERDEYLRYSRHFPLPQFGLEGQAKLKAAAVLVVGAGGLGCPVSLYLTAAGVGHIGLVDFDIVDLSNLQRQVLYTMDDIGLPKTERAKERLIRLNPQIEVTTYDEPLDSSNAERIFADYDIIIGATDNFPTRYLVNDVSVFQGKPNIYGSIYQFDGQVALFHSEKGPCYRCIFPEPPPPGMVPSCAEGGVLGVLPGVIGCLQATEAIKWIIGAGDTLLGRLLLFDALSMNFRQVKLQKNPACPVCGEHPTITEPVDYEFFCGVSGTEEQVAAPSLTVLEVKSKLDGGEKTILLDVREAWEWDIAHLDGATLVPLASLPDRLGDLDPAHEIVVYCHTGERSEDAVNYLIQAGYVKARNMAGGIRAWSLEIDPDLNQY